MPKSLKISCPDNANVNSTPAMTRLAGRTIRSRCTGVSVGVIPRNAGITANGSTMTNSELNASNAYSTVVIATLASWHARYEHRVLHPVDDFFVRRTNRCQHAAQLR